MFEKECERSPPKEPLADAGFSAALALVSTLRRAELEQFVRRVELVLEGEAGFGALMEAETALLNMFRGSEASVRVEPIWTRSPAPGGELRLCFGAFDARGAPLLRVACSLAPGVQA